MNSQVKIVDLIVKNAHTQNRIKKKSDIYAKTAESKEKIFHW